MLSLASCKPNISLLRESVHFGKVNHDELLLLDIDHLREVLCSEIRSHFEVPCLENTDIVRDYLFLCFMLGNDFLPHLPSLHISEGSIDFLLECYGKTINEQATKTPIICGTTLDINMDVLRRCIELICLEEDAMVGAFHKSYSRKKYHDQARGGRKPSKSESEIRRIEFLPMTKPCKNTIQYHREGWRDRYYQQYLSIPREQIEPEDIHSMCRSYHTGLLWTLRYYLKGVPSWSWTYSYPIAPTAQDLHHYFVSGQATPTITFPRTRPVLPHEQLLCILPPSSVDLLPKALQFLMTDRNSPIRDMYPDSFHMEMVYKRFFHEAIPKLPLVDPGRIRSAVRACGAI